MICSCTMRRGLGKEKRPAPSTNSPLELHIGSELES
jgi:hypothetical protein